MRVHNINKIYIYVYLQNVIKNLIQNIVNNENHEKSSHQINNIKLKIINYAVKIFLNHNYKPYIVGVLISIK